MNNILIEKIKKKVEEMDIAMESAAVGRVVSVGDGIVEIEGLTDAVMAEMVFFETSEHKNLAESMAEGTQKTFGLILNLEEDAVKAIVLGDAEKISENTLVKSTGTVLSIPVGDALIGRVINPLAEALDGKGAIKSERTYPIERDAYPVIERKSVDTPVHTGIKSVDAMVPIGRGQRELIIGDRFTGKTTIAIDTILNQKSEPAETRPICIYVAIGQKESKTAQIEALLRERGAMDYTIIVSASAAAPAAMQFLAPFAGATVGEYFMDKGRDAIVIYDDLSKHAIAYRELSLLLRRPPGREAYPGDIFYLHSRLLERAAKLSDEKGGGSLTALPIIETQEGDVSAYIPTNVISITDGQIFLDTDLFNKGFKPAINVGFSVSRVGSSAQTKAMKKVSGKIRLELAQFRELEAFMQFSSDLDPETKARIDSGRRLTEALKQNKNVPLGFERQVVLIFAATNGMLEGVEPEAVEKVSAQYMSFMENQYRELFGQIAASKDLSEQSIATLRKSIETFRSTHLDDVAIEKSAVSERE